MTTRVEILSARTRPSILQEHITQYKILELFLYSANINKQMIKICSTVKISNYFFLTIAKKHTKFGPLDKNTP